MRLTAQRARSVGEWLHDPDAAPLFRAGDVVALTAEATEPRDVIRGPGRIDRRPVFDMNGVRVPALRYRESRDQLGRYWVLPLNPSEQPYMAGESELRLV